MTDSVRIWVKAATFRKLMIERVDRLNIYVMPAEKGPYRAPRKQRLMEAARAIPSRGIVKVRDALAFLRVAESIRERGPSSSVTANIDRNVLTTSGLTAMDPGSFLSKETVERVIALMDAPRFWFVDWVDYLDPSFVYPT